MSPYTPNTQHECLFQTHIREVLLPYARTHLIVDHVAYTEWAIEQLLLEALTFVPIADATSFLLPTDPFDVLIRHLDSLNLKPYEERLTVSECAVQFIRNVFNPLPHLSELRAQKCWLEEGCRYQRISSIYRPMTPILTQRARHETPKLGRTGALASIPQSRLSLKTHWVLDFVADEVIVDPPTPDFHDVLDVRYKLDMASRVKIRSLVQEVLEPTRNNFVTDDAPRVVDFFRSISPTRYPHRLESPPLFARAGRTAHKTAHSKCIHLNGPTMDRIADIAPMVKSASAEVIEEEGDMPGHHMQVINGWSTHTISSPSSYRWNSSSNSDVNELWDISPPGSPPTSLIVAKMEEIEIPRTRKFGHGSKCVRPKDELTNGVGVLSTAKNPGSFITSVITQNSVPVIHNTSGQDTIPMLRPPANICSPSRGVANSLLGQAPSTSEEHDKNTQFPAVDEGEMGMNVDLDTAISCIYASTCDPVSYILEEKLDEKEILLMDVPNLPPPTAYPRLHIERMSSLISAKGANAVRAVDVGKASGTGIVFLSPVKGLKPLALGLSWIPFKFGRSIPTNEEVLRVADTFHPEDDTAGYIDPKVEANIRQLCASPEPDHVDGQSIEIIVRGFENFGASPIPKQDENWDEAEYVLTRRERNKLAVNAHVLEGDNKFRQSLNFQSEGIGQSEYDAECYEYQDLENRGTYDLNPRPESRDFCFHTPSANGENEVLDDVQCLEDPLAYDRVSALDHGHHSEEVDELEVNKENINNNVNIVGSENVPNPGVLEDRNLNVTPLGSRHVSTVPIPSRNEELSTAHDPICHLTEDFAGDSVRKSFAPRAVTHAEHQLDDHPVEASQEENTWLRASKRRKLDHLLPATAKELFATFLGLRNKLPLESLDDRPVTPHASNVPIHTEPPRRATPNEIVDKNTVRLAQWNNPTTTHRYLASMALIQKRALVLELLSEGCKVMLVERYSLGGCEIVLDPDHAILLAPLLALPAQVDALSDRISAESWRYSDILVVFEAYPSARSSRVGDARSVALELYPYSPPIVKAIKKLRRIVSIAEGCGSKNKQCSVIWAFASDVEETAKFVRCFGDEAAGKAAGSGKEALWDEREWLDDEEREGESDLAMAEGMNPFSAVIMLYGQTLEHIFEMSPQGRLEEFGDLIGEERMEMLNSVIMQRKQEMTMTSEPSAVY